MLIRKYFIIYQRRWLSINSWTLSYITRTKDPPIPLKTFDPAPLKKALDPSYSAIFLKQSIVPL